MGKGSKRRPAEVSVRKISESYDRTFSPSRVVCTECGGLVEYSKTMWIESLPNHTLQGFCYGCYLERLHEPTDRTESTGSE